MFHRQKDPESPAQPPLLKERSPIEVYTKPEKESTMYPNQPGTSETSSESETTAQNRPIDIPGASTGLQRPMQPSRMPGTFPGSYSPSPATSYGQQTARTQDGRRLVVGEGISLSGEIESCDVLIVEGTIEAALKGAKVLDIAETGVFYGTVEIEEATIAGRFEGDLTVNGRLTIRASGSITGAIAYKELAIEAGATLDGKVTPLSGSKLEKKSEGRPGPSKKAHSRNEHSGNELPFAEKVSA